MSVKQVVFEEASATADWVWQYSLLQNDHEPGMPTRRSCSACRPISSPGTTTAIAAGPFRRSRNSSYDTAPFFQASSTDGTGVVMLTDPNLIEIRVPYGVMRQMGPGTVHVTLSWRRLIPIVNPLIPDPELRNPARYEHKIRVWAKRLGVPVERIASPLPSAVLGRTTMVTGTLPVIDGVV